MSTPNRRPPAVLKAAAILVALGALIGFVATAGAGGKSNAAADAGVAPKKRTFFPASKSAGGFYPEDREEQTAAKTDAGPAPVQQKANSPVQQNLQR